MGNCLQIRDSSMFKSKKDLDLDLLGVSVYHLENNFMEQVRASFPDSANKKAGEAKIYEIEDLSNIDDNGIIREKGKDTICPIDGKQGAAYVHTLQGIDHVGPASIMLSYTWGYTIGDIVDVLNNYCTTNNLDPKTVYVWICCLCVNQHRVIDKKRRGEVIPFEEFRAVFHKRVTSIGHVLAMMAPWTKPEYLFRVWCIFELFTASQNDECKVTIEMPLRERKDFIDGLENLTQDLDHINTLFKVLSSTNVEHAKASVESDRVDILKLIEAEIGYDRFNIGINDLIRTWVIGLIVDAARSRLEDVFDGGYEYDESCALFLQSVGVLFHRLGEYDSALEMYNIEFKMVEKEFGNDHIDLFPPLVNSAATLKRQGKYEDALHNLNRALSVEEKELPRDPLKMATILHYMGDIYRIEEEYDKAIDVLNQSLAIYKEKFGLDRAETISTLGNIANILLDQGKYEEAIENYQQIMPFYEKEYGSNSVEVALLLSNVAASLHHQGEYEDAMANYYRSLDIREKVYGMNHLETNRTRNNIEIVKSIMQGGKGLHTRGTIEGHI